MVSKLPIWRNDFQWINDYLAFMKRKRVMVSGCFDLLHSGHIAFLESAAEFGELHVCLGNDENILQLKNRPVAQTEKERAYMLSALSCVHAVYIDKGMGKIDFLEEMHLIQPDIFVVNEDGHDAIKQSLMESRGIEYVVLKRSPMEGLPERSTTAIRRETQLPYRIDLAGGWMDQPFVSKHAAGSVITLNIWPTHSFNDRSGMATSTRKSAARIWGHQFPIQDEELTSKILFAFDNPPGTVQVSGSQDAIGLVYRGVNRLDYQGEYWPCHIEQCLESDVMEWLESKIYLVPIAPRNDQFEVLSNYKVFPEAVMRLSQAASDTWNAIVNKDTKALGLAMKASLDAQLEMFPLMWNDEAENVVAAFSSSVAGYKISGAGGGGYIVAIADEEVPNGLKIKVRFTR
jgi:cytidyltransferase-like protein